MANQVYEKWWMNLTEDDCGIYYRSTWYSTEQDLNSGGYYIVYKRKLYLGEVWSMFKYHGDWYNIDNNYYTYSQAHTYGYSVNRSITLHYINKTKLTHCIGYYNSIDGYFVENEWYPTLQDLHNANYEVGTSNVLIYKTDELVKYSAIVNEVDNVPHYFVPDLFITDWITEDQFSLYKLSFLPSVEMNWNLGASFSNNVGHGGHSQYSSNFYQCERGFTQVTINNMHNLFGKVATRGEWDCAGAYVGSYKSDLAGYKLWFEGYNGSSAGGSITNVVASFYTNNTSLNVYSTAYGQFSPIAVTYNKSTEVVKVYNNSNYAYSAFKILHNNEIYYYVLDNNHNYWTTSLESIGYSLSYNDSLRIIYTYYGDVVNIPIGYHINRIDCNIAYTFPKYVTTEGDQMIVAYDGKDVYTNELNYMMLQQSSSNNYPYLCILQGTGWQSSSPHLTGVRFSSDGNDNNSNVAISEALFNGSDASAGDYFIYIKGTDYSSYALSSRPARLFMYPTYQSKASVDPYMFKAPQSIWSFTNGVFSWLGDTTDSHDLAYYYYNDWKESTGGNVRFNIHIEPNTDADMIRNIVIYDIVNGSTKTVEYWPHNGYLYNSVYYTEQQLLLLGYSLTDIHNDYEWESVTSLKLSTEQTLTIYYNSNIGYVVKDVGTFTSEIALNNAGYIINPVYDISQVRLYFDGNNLNADTYKTRLSTNWATINDTQYVRRLYLDSELTEPAVYESGKLYYYNDSLSSMDAPGYHINNIARFPDYTVTDNNQKTSLVNIISEHGTPNMPLVTSDEGGGLWIYGCNNKEGTNTVIIPTFYADCYRTPYEGSETFYYLENEYTLNYITTVNHSRYYRSPIGGFFTEQELLSKGYTRTPSSTVLCSDTNVELNIDDIYNAMYNTQHGYYINSHWYATVQALNNAGYYLVEKSELKTIYCKTSPGGGWYYNNSITSKSTSFNTSYKKAVYTDSSYTQLWQWDGHKWLVDIEATGQSESWLKSRLKDMPSSTTSGTNWTMLIMPITSQGNPLSQYRSAEIGDQMYFYIATNYYTSLSTSGDYCTVSKVFYWKLI